MKSAPMIFRAIVASGATFLAASSAHSQLLFSDNFDSLAGSPVVANSGGLFNGYNVAMLSTDNRVTFGYDYSVANLGIPTAPHSTGGSQIGVRLDPNRTLGVISSLTMSPASTFSGNISIHFDMWANSIGPFPGGGTSSSHNMTVGVGWNGTSVQNNTSGSGVWFSATGDGGFSGTSGTPDYEARIISTLQGPATAGVYAAGTATGASTASVDNNNAYYTTRFPSQPYPAAQVTAFPASQTGTPPAGALLFKWHDVQVDRFGNVVMWYIDGNLIATINNAAASATDSIDIGAWDPGASSATSGLVFTLIDNLTITQIPEPSVAALIALGIGGFVVSRRRKAA